MLGEKVSREMDKRKKPLKINFNDFFNSII